MKGSMKYRSYTIHFIRKEAKRFTKAHKDWRENPTPEIDYMLPVPVYGDRFIEDCAIDGDPRGKERSLITAFDRIYYNRKLKKRITLKFVQYLHWELRG